MTSELRNLPQIQALLQMPSIAEVARRFSLPETRDALRAEVSDLRVELQKGMLSVLPAFDAPAFADEIAARIEASRRSSLRRVINATGILIHTNLGRAPLAEQAIAAMNKVAAAPSNLELSLQNGKRGSRHDHVEQLICGLTGAQAAVVVNNCAAAVLLSLMATAQGRHVVASRGELIEIGGSFRLPDVIAQSGATLREVGATNKTRLSDYADAVDAQTAVLLKSHTSNFKIVGFTAAPDRRDLAKLANEKDVILIEDLGSGVLIDLSPYGLGDEPVVSEILKTGVDLVMFSGDKLLGGPQAGIIAGRADIIAQLKAHPLMRAVRVDKLSLAALEATLRLYNAPFDPLADIPVLRMLSEPLDDVRLRGQRLLDLIKGQVGKASLMQTIAYVGAGSLPEQDLQSYAVAVSKPNFTAQRLSEILRQAETPVVGRIEDDRVLLDMRTVRDPELPALAKNLGQIAGV